MTHYIYCSTLVSTIVLRVIIILLFTLIVIINIIIFYHYYYCYHYFILFQIYLVILFFYSLFIYLLIRGPIRPEGGVFGKFLNPGMLRVEGVS